MLHSKGFEGGVMAASVNNKNANIINLPAKPAPVFMIRNAPSYFVGGLPEISEVKVNFLAMLPPELALETLSYLGNGDLRRCSLVSRHWNHLASDDGLWRKLTRGVGISQQEGIKAYIANEGLHSEKAVIERLQKRVSTVQVEEQLSIELLFLNNPGCYIFLGLSPRYEPEDENLNRRVQYIFTGSLPNQSGMIQTTCMTVKSIYADAQEKGYNACLPCNEDTCQTFLDNVWQPFFDYGNDLG